MEVLFNFCCINFSPSHMVEAAEPLEHHFGPLDTYTRVKAKSRRLKPDQMRPGAYPREEHLKDASLG
jgi:hypothetical protein